MMEMEKILSQDLDLLPNEKVSEFPESKSDSHQSSLNFEYPDTIKKIIAEDEQGSNTNNSNLEIADKFMN